MAGISYEDETSYTSMRGSFVDGQAWFDGEILGSELINNPTMETNITGWNPSGSPTIFEQSAEQAYAGTKSLKFTVDANNEGAYTFITTITGVLYKVVFYIYPDDTTNLKFTARQGDGVGNNISEVITGLTQDAWNKIELYYIELGGGALGTFRVDAGAEVAGTWYLDNPSVKPVTSLSTQSFSGNLLVCDDGDGDIARGFIGEAGAGEVLGALPNNITAITKANPGVVSSIAHNLVVGKLVYFSGLTEMTELNGTYKVVTAVGGANSFSINNTLGYGAAETTGGACGKEVTEPNANAVKIYKERALINEGWESIGSIDYNAGSSWDFDVYGASGGAAQQWW